MALFEIQTERLLLRQWRDGDWNGLHRTYSDPEVMRWVGGPSPDVAFTAAAVGRMSMHWRLLGYGMFAVEERSGGGLVGRIGLLLHPDWPLEGPKVEVGWTLQRSVWGRGYATEGARASLEFGFRELGLPQIFSMTRPDNLRSLAVMERCGLTRRGELEFHGHRQVYYAIDREDAATGGSAPGRCEIRRTS